MRISLKLKASLQRAINNVILLQEPSRWPAPECRFPAGRERVLAITSNL